MAANNLFRHNEFNANKEASPGFFEDNGRVKPIKLQGVPSEGFIMPIDSLYKWLDFIGESHEVVTNLKEGTEFDSLDKHILCKKYAVNPPKTSGNSSRQVQQWCKDKGLTPVTELYYGYAKDLYPDISISEHWNENFIQRLAEDKNFFMEELSLECHNDVPHEGIVIRIENGLSEAYKLKCFRFLGEESKSLDKGEVDIESDQ